MNTPSTDSPFYLIEQDDAPLWFRADGWTNDAARALQFATKDAAQYFIETHGMKNVVVTEHLFCQPWLHHHLVSALTPTVGRNAFSTLATILASVFHQPSMTEKSVPIVTAKDKLILTKDWMATVRLVTERGILPTQVKPSHPQRGTQSRPTKWNVKLAGKILTPRIL